MKDLWVPLSGAIAQQRYTETVANNVANASTPGFKRDELAFKEHLTALENGHHEIDLPNKEFKPEDFYKSYGAEHSMVKVDGSYTDFSQGRLSPTGNPFDLAINGKGFFEILTPNGVKFTRKGMFSLSRERVLVNDQGFPVLGKFDAEIMEQIKNNKEVPTNLPSPESRVIKFDPGKITVNLEGQLFVNNENVNNISVVEFVDVNALRKQGNSVFINRNPNNIKTEIESTVHQGFVEESNVNAVSEMSKLIKAHRHFESIQKVIRTYDNMASKSVNELLKF